MPDGEQMRIMDIMGMTENKMKVSNYQKALDRMEKETARAIARVEKLSKLYDKVTKK